MRKILIIASIILILQFVVFREKKVEYGPGVMVPSVPVQVKIEEDISFRYKSFNIIPMATIDMTAKILSKKNYYFDEEANLCPIDIAVGWGNMSDESVLKNIDITQSNRWYYWSTENSEIARREIQRSSANMHLIPSNDSIMDAIKNTGTGNIVILGGMLVTAIMDNGRRWSSSLTRVDTGADSCELIWVENYEILDMNIKNNISNASN